MCPICRDLLLCSQSFSIPTLLVVWMCSFLCFHHLPLFLGAFLLPNLSVLPCMFIHWLITHTFISLRLCAGKVSKIFPKIRPQVCMPCVISPGHVGGPDLIRVTLLKEGYRSETKVREIPNCSGCCLLALKEQTTMLCRGSWGGKLGGLWNLSTAPADGQQESSGLRLQGAELCQKPRDLERKPRQTSRKEGSWSNIRLLFVSIS